MTTLFTTEFWMAVQMLTIFLLLVLLVYFMRHSKAGAIEDTEDEDHDGIPETAGKVIDLMEPLIQEAEKTARLFEVQIMEKKKLIRDLNEKLDSRIISLNLLLNRADAYIARNDDGIPADRISDTQEAILDLYEQGFSSQAISDKLSVSGQEVDLVISLKKKFVAMEKGS